MIRYCTGKPLGVFAGIAPFNFPAMIPYGWMIPLCIAAGNTFVLKAASYTPLTSLRMLELLLEAGLPQGVVNIVTCSRNEAELLLTHPYVRGVSFVGSTSVGQHVYTTAAAHGKPGAGPQCEAKNHAPGAGGCTSGTSGGRGDQFRVRLRRHAVQWRYR